MQKVRKGHAMTRSPATRATALSTSLELLEQGYKSLITPPLRDLACIYALALGLLRTLVHRA